MKTIDVSIKGIVPLLQNKMSVEAETQLGAKVKRRAGHPKDENVEDCLYRIGDKICQPSEHIYQAIVKKLSDYKIQGRGKKSYKEIGKGGIEVTPEYIPHKNQK